MPNSEDSLAKQLCMSGIYLDHSIVEQIKICFKHCTYMCCKVINQCLTARIPQQNSFACLAYTLITVLQSKEKICFGHGTNLCRKIINQCLTVRIAQQKSLPPLAYTLITVFQIKEKTIPIIAPTCAVKYSINHCLTVRIPQQKGFAPLAYTLITVLQSKEKIFRALHLHGL